MKENRGKSWSVSSVSTAMSSIANMELKSAFCVPLSCHEEMKRGKQNPKFLLFQLLISFELLC